MEDVPGIGRITGERASRKRSASAGSRLPEPSGAQGRNGIPRCLARLEHVVRLAIGRVEAVLHRDDRHDPLGLLELGDAHVREADVADLPRLAQLLQRADRLRERDAGVGRVQLVDVDPLQPQPPQASFARLAQVLGAPVGLPSPRAGARVAALRRDHEPLGIRMQRLGDLPLVDLGAVRVGGVDQGDPELDHPAQDAQGILGIRRLAPDAGTAEPHRPEAEAPDLEVADPHAPSAAYTSSYALHGVLLLLGGAEGGLVDLGGDAVDEVPLQHGALDRADGVLRVRVEVEAEALAVLAVVRAAQLERELERLHERGRADHVVVVEGAPAAVGVLVAEQALGVEQRGVLGEVLPVHDQVLPVHVDLDVVDALGAQLVDHVQRHADVAHEDLHRRLGVLVLEEHRHAVLASVLRPPRRRRRRTAPTTPAYGVWNG